MLQAFWLKTDFNKWKDEDESDDDMDKNMDLAEVPGTFHLTNYCLFDVLKVVSIKPIQRPELVKMSEDNSVTSCVCTGVCMDRFQNVEKMYTDNIYMYTYINNFSCSKVVSILMFILHVM